MKPVSSPRMSAKGKYNAHSRMPTSTADRLGTREYPASTRRMTRKQYSATSARNSLGKSARAAYGQALSSQFRKYAATISPSAAASRQVMRGGKFGKRRKAE